MSAYFLDSSALVKRYLDEVGSARITALTDTDVVTTIILADIQQIAVEEAFSNAGPIRIRECSLRVAVY